jgi:hypothetical protein
VKITTTFIPATDTAGSKIRARTDAGTERTVGYDHASNDPHGDLARELTGCDVEVVADRPRGFVYRTKGDDHTYADGFGVWHAYVKSRAGGREIVIARRLIREELEARGTVDAAYVRRAVVEHEEQDREGFVHFWEGK